MSKAQELREELRLVLMGRGVGVAGAVLPLLIFILLNPYLGVKIALGGSLTAALVFAVVQIVRKERVIFVLGGIGGVLIAWLFVSLSGSETGFFLPGLFSGVVMVVLSIFSILINRPLVAWFSFISRRWRLNWYWHPKVLPAYRETTMIWAGAFLVRLVLEYWIFIQGDLNAIGAIRVFLGWPYTIVLLIGSYIFGQRRLVRLGGPSVKEFISGSEPPWEGQQRGF